MLHLNCINIGYTYEFQDLVATKLNFIRENTKIILFILAKYKFHPYVFENTKNISCICTIRSKECRFVNFSQSYNVK